MSSRRYAVFGAFLAMGFVVLGTVLEAMVRYGALPFGEALRRATSPPCDAKTLVALGLYGLKLAGLWTPDQADRPPPDAPARRAAARPS